MAMNERAPNGPAGRAPDSPPVEFSCEGSVFIDIDESQTEAAHFDEAMWQYLEKKYGKRRKTPPPPPEPQ
jgi:hypothetical protein